jgi:ADP-ribose pyrophosphatase
VDELSDVIARRVESQGQDPAQASHANNGHLSFLASVLQVMTFKDADTPALRVKTSYYYASMKKASMNKQVSAKKPKSASKGNIKVISSKLVYKGPVFSVFTDRVREGEHTGQRDVIRHTGSVVMMAVDESAKSGPKVLLVRQYRYATNQSMWELPAGRIDEGENKLAAAKRELLEETGVTAKNWKRLFQFYASPGFLDETMDVFLARDLMRGQAQPEEDEQIAVRFFPLQSALKMVHSGDIRDAKTMTGLLWLLSMVDKGARKLKK